MQSNMKMKQERTVGDYQDRYRELRIPNTCTVISCESSQLYRNFPFSSKSPTNDVIATLKFQNLVNKPILSSSTQFSSDQPAMEISPLPNSISIRQPEAKLMIAVQVTEADKGKFDIQQQEGGRNKGVAKSVGVESKWQYFRSQDGEFSCCNATILMEDE